MSKAHFRANYAELDLRTKPSVGIELHTKHSYTTAAEQGVPSRYSSMPN